MPEGEWRDIYDKQGYPEERSGIYHLPTPRMNVNVGMISFDAPVVDPVISIVSANSSSSSTNSSNNNTGQNSYIEIHFNKFIPVNNFTSATVKIFSQENKSFSTISSNSLNGTISALHPVYDPHGIIVSRQAIFTPSQPLIAGKAYLVRLYPGIESYAGVPMSANYSSIVTIAQPLPSYSLKISTSAVLDQSLIASANTYPLNK